MAILSAREEHEPFENWLRHGKKKLAPGKGLKKEKQNEVVKSNFLYTLHLNGLIGPII